MFQEHHVFILADFLFHSMNLFFVLDESVFYQMILRFSDVAGSLSDVFFYQTLFLIRCK